MYIQHPPIDLETAKEVKVKIPVRHHVRLHSMKVLTGKQIGDAVSEALDAYFASEAYREALGRHASPARVEGTET